MFSVLELSIQLRKYLRLDSFQPIPAITSFDTPIHFGLDICLEFVDILLDSTYCPTIVDYRLFAIMRHYRVNLAHVYRNRFACFVFGWRVDFVDQ